MPGSPRRRVWAQPDGHRVRIPAPEPRATPPPAAAPPLGPPLPPARAAASSEDALVKGRGGADGCRAQSMAMAMADLLVQDQPIDDNVPDAEGESSEMDTPFRGGAMPSVSQTGSGKAALLGKDSIHKATATLQDVYSAAGAVQPIFHTGMGRPVPVSRISIDKARAVLEGQTVAGKEDKEKSTHLRFLVSNTAAGCIFGKGGSTINDFQSLSGAHIQFSCSHEFLPGTNDRIIMVSGLFDEVVKAMQLVLERLLSEGGESNEAEARPEFKLLVPNSSCGGIIGKGGATIKSFIEDSHAGIKISPEDNNSVDLHDMLVTITGSLSSQMRAIYLILSKLSEDVHYPPNLSSPFPYAGLGFPSYPAAVPARYMIPQVPYNDAVNYGPNGYAGDGGGRYQNKKPAATMAAAPPPALPDDLIEEILRRLPPDDPASLLCASLVCKTWSHIAKVKLKRAQQQEHLKRAQLQLHLKRAQQLEHAQVQEQLEGAQLQMQLQHAQLQELLERAQLQMQLKRAQLQEQLEGAQLQEQLECARLQELQEQLEGAQLKRTQLQTQLEGAQLQEQLERDQLQMQLECAQLQMQLERAQLQEQLELDQLQMQLECIQLQEELNQLQRRSASSSSRAPSCRRRSASSRGGQPAAQARPAWRY